MPVYLTKVTDPSGENKSITVKARNIEQVKSGLSKRGFRVKSINEIDEREDKVKYFSAKLDIRLKDLTHPKERSRFILAVIVNLLIMISLIILSLLSSGAVLIMIGAIVLIVWFVLQILKAKIVGNTIKVSNTNFPQINNLLEHIKWSLDYNKKIEVYIIEKGSINAHF